MILKGAGRGRENDGGRFKMRLKMSDLASTTSTTLGFFVGFLGDFLFYDTFALIENQINHLK